MAKKVILDVDPGIDDAMALCMALFDPRLEVLAVTAVGGNVSPQIASRNVQTVVEQVDPPRWPRLGVASYAEHGLPVDGRHLHGIDGLGGVHLQVAELRTKHPAEKIICDEVRANPEEVTIVALGPLTNIARAFHRHEDMPSMLKELIVMGGAFGLTRFGTGNTTPFAEFNIWQDPDAAYSVFRSGVPMTIVGLDVTNDPSSALDRADLNSLRAGTTREAALAANMLDYLLREHPRCEMHDPLAVAVALDRSLFQFQEGTAYVVTRDDAERGRTILRTMDLSAGSRPQVRVAAAVDGPRFKRLFMSRILGS